MRWSWQTLIEVDRGCWLMALSEQGPHPEGEVSSVQTWAGLPVLVLVLP